MENQSRTSKFVSRQTAKMIEQSKKVCVFLMIGAVLGVVSMGIALSVVHKRANPQTGAQSGMSAYSNPDTEVESGDFTFERNGSQLTLVSYEGSDSAVEIPESVNGARVTQIGENAFKDNKTVMSVTMPDTVAYIGTNAFYGCTSLIHVEMSQSLVTISENAFASCKMLKSIVLPQSFMGGAANAFANCDKEFALTVSEGSNAQTYAQTNGIAFKLAGEETEE